MTAFAPIRVALCVTLVAVLAACGGAAPADPATPAAPDLDAPAAPADPEPGADQPPPADGPTGTADACALLTADEVADGLSVDVAQVESDTGEMGAAYCRYLSDISFPLLTVSLNRDNPVLYETFAAGSEAVEVPGLADGAVIAARTLYFRVGNTTIGLATTGPAGSTEDNLDSLRLLAARLIDRL